MRKRERTSVTELAEFFHDNGFALEAAANRPFLLSDPGNIFFIKSGSVDVFAVSLENGKAVGRRRFVAHFSEGQVLLGFGDETTDDGITGDAPWATWTVPAPPPGPVALLPPAAEIWLTS